MINKPSFAVRMKCIVGHQFVSYQDVEGTVRSEGTVSLVILGWFMKFSAY